MKKNPHGDPLSNFPLSSKSQFYKAINRIDWKNLRFISKPFRRNYASIQPLRRIIGMILLKKAMHVNYEILILNWLEFHGMQYFTGEDIFHWEAPITSEEILEAEQNLSFGYPDHCQNTSKTTKSKHFSGRSKTKEIKPCSC